jgi:nickel-dependent lactate racemase
LEFWLPYGVTEVPIAVPDENLLGFLQPLDDSTGENVEAILPTALQFRIGEETLVEAAARSKKTVIAFNSKSTTCALLASLLARGLLQTDAEGVLLLESALDPTQPGSSRALLGKDQEASCPLTRHDPKKSPSAKVGQLQDGGEVLLNEAFVGAEIRCVVANVAVNSFWGYSGGPSFIVLGLASEKTIKATLRPALRSTRRPAVISEKPAYEALLRASQMARVDFAVHLIERPDGKVAGVFAGDFLGTFQEACALAGKVFRPALEHKADIVISSAGGAPWDQSLFDASQAAMMAASCCKDHGIIILVAECADGVGGFPSLGLPVHASRGHPEKSQRGLTLEKLVEYSLQKLAAEHRVYLVSTLPEHQASRYGLLAARSVGSALQRALRHAGRDARLALIPYGCHTAPLVGQPDFAERDRGLLT